MHSSISNDLCTPYPVWESIAWLWRNIHGERKGNPYGIRPLPQEAVLNLIRTQITLGFVGDIMDMGGKTLTISPDVRLFFQDCNYLFGNMEGMITQAGKTEQAAQAHDPSVLDALAALFPPDHTFLSVANNHAGDFSQAIFRQSVDSLRKRGFCVFGLRQAPFADIGGRVRVVAASMWSDHPCEEIASPASLGECRSTTAFNIAYPHWGYEMELFPRPAIVRAGERLLQTYDAVVGHHSHVPQPVAALQCGDTAKLLAFSLGDFCVGLNISKFQYGMICKVEIGPGEDGIWRIGTINWRYTRVAANPPRAMRVELAEDTPL